MKILTLAFILSLAVMDVLSAPTEHQYFLTPENINDQDLKITIETKSGGPHLDNGVFFLIYVSSGKKEMSPERSGGLLIQGELAQDILANLAVEGRTTSGVVRYTFSLHKKFVKNSRFVFTTFEPGTLKDDQYIIRLGDFVELDHE